MSYICENCGKEFEEDYRVYRNLKTVRFCSKSCKCAFNGKKAPGFQKGHPNYNLKNEKKPSNLDLSCPYCKRIFKNPGGLQRHIYGCRLNPEYEAIKATGKYTEKIHGEKWQKAMKNLRGRSKPLSPEVCKYCGRDFSYKESCHNHEKYCKKNPYRISAPSHLHTEETKQKLSFVAKKNHLGGSFSRKDISYNGTTLNSSYEFHVAKSLDENNIKWIRPSSLDWKDSKGINHKYYADFYLPDYNIYLDPKNDFLIKGINSYFGISDTEKIKKVEEQNNVKVLILDKDNLTWDKIKEKL